MKRDRKYDFIVVGSGAGGATLAMELAKKGKSVLVVERGIREEKVGGVMDAIRFYDFKGLTKAPLKSKEGVILWRTLMAGGSTVVSCGNGVSCREEELAEFGINLDTEFSDMERETGITLYDERRLSKGSKMILEASKTLGYKMEPMPKFIDPKKCRRCSNCALGCKYHAKWTALDFLDKAIENGAEILYKTLTERVLIENGKVKGVSLIGPGGHTEIMANAVILSAGGLGTPVILQKSGVEEAGTDFFLDLLVNTYGIAKDLNQTDEPTMALVDHEFYKSKGFIISPFLHQSRLTRLYDIGMKGMRMPTHGLLGLMTKTRDESSGRIYSDGTFSKPVTDKDWEKLNEGSSISKEILIKAGVDSKSITVSKVQGAHPGGSAAIGKVVDKDLQTNADNLFVCDGSVLPTSPGLPPILTIIALAKRLANTLAP